MTHTLLHAELMHIFIVAFISFIVYFKNMFINVVLNKMGFRGYKNVAKLQLLVFAINTKT